MRGYYILNCRSVTRVLYPVWSYSWFPCIFRYLIRLTSVSRFLTSSSFPFPYFYENLHPSALHLCRIYQSSRSVTHTIRSTFPGLLHNKYSRYSLLDHSVRGRCDFEHHNGNETLDTDNQPIWFYTERLSSPQLSWVDVKFFFLSAIHHLNWWFKLSNVNRIIGRSISTSVL